jgi:hypothetical protein
MLSKGLLLTTALGLIIGSTPNARADLCFRYTKTGGGTLVARGAQVPPRDTCQALALFESGPGGGAGAANGTICKDGDANNTVIFHYTYHSCLGPSYFESGTCRIMVTPDNTFVSSSCRGTFATDGSMATFIVVDDGVIQSCAGITVPGGGGGACTAKFLFHNVQPVPGAPPAR